MYGVSEGCSDTQEEGRESLPNDLQPLPFHALLKPQEDLVHPLDLLHLISLLAPPLLRPSCTCTCSASRSASTSPTPLLRPPTGALAFPGATFGIVQ